MGTDASALDAPIHTPVRRPETLQFDPIYVARTSRCSHRVESSGRPVTRNSHRGSAPPFEVGQNSVIRAGWGIFYDVAFSTALDPINGFPFNRWQFSSGTAATVTCQLLRLSDSAMLSGLRLPYHAQWNVAYERMFGTLELRLRVLCGFVGRRLLRYEGMPQPAPRWRSTWSRRTMANPVITASNCNTSGGCRARFQAIAAYTWSHSIDNGSSDSGVYLADPAAAGRGHPLSMFVTI